MSRKNRSLARRPLMGGIAPTPVEFNPDYTHVKRDLRRIGTLAALFFGLLFALSFVLR